jgi:hypothetical protein
VAFMKRILATILAFVYLSTSIGATVHLHYCMGKLTSWGLIDHDSNSYSSCGKSKNTEVEHCMAPTGGCCKDEHKPVKIDKDQKATEFTYSFSIPPCDIAAGNFATLTDQYGASYIAEYPTSNGPPDPDKIPVYIRNCDFRI